MSKLKINDIIRQRSFLMGIAILWIMMYHSEIVIGNSYIRHIKSLGYGGVDIFLFCSGMGCYFSYFRERDLIAFFKRRISRIFPQWILFMLLWIPLNCFVNHISVNAILGNLLCLQALTGLGNDMNWYISALWVLYILAPYLCEACDRSTWKQNLAILVFLTLLSIPFWNSDNYIIMVSRIPIFFMGILAAKYKDFELNRYVCFGSIIIAILSAAMIIYIQRYMSAYMWSYAIWWYPFILIVPGISIVVTFIAQYGTKNLWGGVSHHMLSGKYIIRTIYVPSV